MTARITIVEHDGTVLEFALRDNYSLHVQPMHEWVNHAETREGLGLVISGFIENPPNKVVTTDGTHLALYDVAEQWETKSP